MKIVRRKAKVVKIGNVKIGGNNPIAIQSMAKTKTARVCETIRQIKELEGCGCEIVRLAIEDSQDASALKEIKAGVNIPIVADIHFRWQLAIEAIDNGADKIRLNPGNIYKKEEIREVVSALKNAKIPLRIGLNSGSVRGLNNKKFGMAQRLVRSGLNYIKFIESLKFYNIVISLKASSVRDTLDAYRMMARLCDYPLHLGVTATGLPFEGAVKSSIAVGALLLEGIGDTIRISLTDRPQEEVRQAKAILGAIGLRGFGPEVISCPTCGRCEVDLVKTVKEFENKLNTVEYKLPAGNALPLKVAMMGCVVNGPGEAREADIGIAFGRKDGLLFKKGKSVRRVSYLRCVETLLKEMEEDDGQVTKR